jgi:isopentenyldiphosphate isomerase
MTAQVTFNAAEVSEVAFIDLAELAAQMAADPQKFTQWFREEAELLGLLSLN